MNTLQSISIRVIRFTVAGALGLMLLDFAAAQPLGDSSATTESSCNFGMVKGQVRQSCQVPFLSGCVVASFPGTTSPWSNISKGGVMNCRFNEKETDWKTRITGTCDRCKTPQCSARFGVMFNCSANMPPISQPPQKANP